MVDQGPVPPPDRSAAGAGRRAARRGARRVGEGAARRRRRRTSIQAQKSYERSAEIKKANPQLISDEQLEQLRTAVDVNTAIVEAPKHAVDQAIAALDDAQERARQDDDLRADGGPRHAARRRAGRNGDPGHVQQGRGDAAHDQRHVACSRRKVKVDETDVARISVGDSAQVQIDAFPDTTFLGRVTEDLEQLGQGRDGDAGDDRSGSGLRGHDPAAQRAAGHASRLLGHGEDHHGHADTACCRFRSSR